MFSIIKLKIVFWKKGREVNICLVGVNVGKELHQYKEILKVNKQKIFNDDDWAFTKQLCFW